MTNNVSSIKQFVTAKTSDTPPLSDMTEMALKDYLSKLNGHAPVELYDLVLREVEVPLFRLVMDYTRGNQSRAADILGINRGTLRKKLKKHGLMA